MLDESVRPCLVNSSRVTCEVLPSTQVWALVTLESTVTLDKYFAYSVIWELMPLVVTLLMSFLRNRFTTIVTPRPKELVTLFTIHSVPTVDVCIPASANQG